MHKNYSHTRSNSTDVLDDWKDDKYDAWDYETILKEHEVTVEDDDSWSLSWKHGNILIGPTTEIFARKAAALFVSLWLRGISASFSTRLMDGYLIQLECRAGIMKLSHLTNSKNVL